MKNLFAPNKVVRYQNEVNSLQSAYREAIQLNKEFREVKKIYADLKKSERELEKAMKDKGKSL
jgi:hypothetical protein